MKITGLLAAILTAIIVSSCSAYKIPEKISDANAIVKKEISALASADFFERYFLLLPEKSREETNEIRLVYLESIPEIEYSDTVLFVVSDKKITNLKQLKGIPDCIEDERNCTFEINRDKVLEILTVNNLLDVNNEFILKSVWDSSSKRFLWKATITKEKFNAGNSVRAKGIYVFIHPATGEITETREWRVN